MLGNGCKNEGHSKPQRGHSTTTTLTTHGMDYSKKNIAIICQKEPKNPLIWQPKDLNKEACTMTYYKAQKNNSSKLRKDGKCKHTSMEHGLK